MLLAYCKRWLWVLLFLWALPAQAQDFKTHYDLAMALYQAQRYTDVIAEFKARRRLRPCRLGASRRSTRTRISRYRLGNLHRQTHSGSAAECRTGRCRSSRAATIMLTRIGLSTSSRMAA